MYHFRRNWRHLGRSDFIYCDRKTFFSCIEKYKPSCGFPDSRERLCVAPWAVDPGTNVDGPSGRSREIRTESTYWSELGSGLANGDEQSPLSRHAHPKNLWQNDICCRKHVDSDATMSKNHQTSYYFKNSKFTGNISQSIELTPRDYNVSDSQQYSSEK